MWELYLLGCDDMIMCTISVSLNFDLCIMMVELIETVPFVTAMYREICCKKKVSTKLDARV